MIITIVFGKSTDELASSAFSVLIYALPFFSISICVLSIINKKSLLTLLYLIPAIVIISMVAYINNNLSTIDDECPNMPNYVSVKAKNGICPDKRCITTDATRKGKPKRCCCPSVK